jgi:predicted AAA+ superfamily ATPase
MTIRPWREIAIPNQDVLRGTFQQSEFAADITAVRKGKAEPVYQDAASFFARTYITEGMQLLLTQVVQRLAGHGGEPVIQLQTAFGGGKTHTMLAVWHLATRTCELRDLPGVAPLVEKAGVVDFPKANVAIIDGTAYSPGQPWTQGRTTIRTLWGELAWQLGRAEGYALVAEADASGTSPGKEVLRQLLEKHAPCVVLMDELVAYIGQFEAGAKPSGGSFESNVAFVQALTEAVKVVPNAILLASLPESEIEVGSERGVQALKALERRFGRVQALWRPVATEESFEIVRRRLFEPIKDEMGRDAVCRAFADMYVAEGASMPGETQEGRYLDRLRQAYPMHPELFDRLYEDWTTIEGFQRTRGVLKLMAKVIHRLWRAQNADLMIMPGSLPLAEQDVSSEMTYLLPNGWPAVIERDIDGDRAETTELEQREPRFGQVHAARRVARTVFLGSAPSSVSTRATTRGVDRARVLLGCLQPGQTSALYADALGRLADRLHYLNSNGDRGTETTRYWFDTRANLRREMEDRKRRFDDNGEVRKCMQSVARKLFASSTLFDGVHEFTTPTDVKDDSALRLVVLAPESAYLKEAPNIAEDAVRDYLRSHGSQPRLRANRLLFIAPDQVGANRLRDAVRTALAWESIVADVDGGKLNIDQVQKRQAKDELLKANDLLPRVGRECFKWLLCPAQEDPTASAPVIEVFPIATSGGTHVAELERVCQDNELVITTWAAIHLRESLRRLYWKNGRIAVDARTYWEDTQRYVYLPRLKSREVLRGAISKGAGSRDFFGIAEGQSGDRFDGFKFGEPAGMVGDSVLLIEPSAAAEYAAKLAAEKAPAEKPAVSPATSIVEPVRTPSGPVSLVAPAIGDGPGTYRAVLKEFHASADVNASTAKVRFSDIADEIIKLLVQDPRNKVTVTVEVHAEFPQGAEEQVRRSVSENAKTLQFKSAEWS